MREILIDITIIFFSLYGAGRFALDAFRYAERVGQAGETARKRKLEILIPDKETQKIIKKYTA